MKFSFGFFFGLLLTALALGLALYLYLHYTAFGRLPDAERRAQFASSPHYDAKAEKFKNPIEFDMYADMHFLPMLKEYIFGTQIRTPTAPLPQMTPNIAEFLEKGATGISFIWFGHSTLFLNFHGKTILIDPVFSDFAGPIPIFTKRFQPSLLKVDELPEVDFVVISHEHYDHLDHRVIQSMTKKRTQFLTPLGIGSRIASWGIDPAKVKELDWWESIDLLGVKWTAGPAQHFSGRGIGDAGKVFWASWAIEYAGRKIFYSGDTGYSPHFKEIGQRLGPFELAIIESGQYNLRWPRVHLMPEQMIQAVQDVRAKQYLPVHWGMFNLSVHDWFEPITRASALADRAYMEILTPQIGQVVRLGEANALTRWWENHPDYRARHANPYLEK